MRSIETEFYNCGQQVIVIDSEMLEELQQKFSYKDADLPKGMLDHAEKMLELTLRHDVFICGLVKTKNYRGYAWFPMIFFDNGEELHRVSVHNARCQKCNWQGLAADPTVPGLFDTVEDSFSLMKNAAKLKSVPCPSCGSKLDHHGMHAVWVCSEDRG